MIHISTRPLPPGWPFCGGRVEGVGWGWGVGVGVGVGLLAPAGWHCQYLWGHLQWQWAVLGDGPCGGSRDGGGKLLL